MKQVEPLKNIDELLSWGCSSEEEHFLSKLPGLPKIYSGLPNRRRTMVCHDFKGGYRNDNFVQISDCEKCDLQNDYIFFHWDYCDLFVYFSHCLVTIPPIGWICAAHRNSTPILGTFITEHKAGYELCCQLLKDKSVSERLADQLVLIAQKYKLQGWLINIENKLDSEQIQPLLTWLKYLRTQLHDNVPHSHLVWYDSVRADNGKLQWQDELNGLNMPFYQACDAIYLNYCWNEKKVKNSAENSKPKEVNNGGTDQLSQTGALKGPYDVYVGLDVFGRGCFGGGKYNSDKAVIVCAKFDISLAIFAPGWSLECASGKIQCDNSFLTRDKTLWSKMEPYLPAKESTMIDLPFETNFNFGLCRNQNDGESFDTALYSLCSTATFPANALNYMTGNVKYQGLEFSEGIYLGLDELLNQNCMSIANLKFDGAEQINLEVNFESLIEGGILSADIEVADKLGGIFVCAVLFGLADKNDLRSSKIERVQKSLFREDGNKIEQVKLFVKIEADFVKTVDTNKSGPILKFNRIKLI